MRRDDTNSNQQHKRNSPSEGPGSLGQEVRGPEVRVGGEGVGGQGTDQQAEQHSQGPGLESVKQMISPLADFLPARKFSPDYYHRLQHSNQHIQL